MNQLKEIENLTSADSDNYVLTDLWVNQNKIDSWTSVQYLLKLKALDTIYLHSNPVASASAPEETKEECIEDNSGIKVAKYTDWIIENLPWV